MTSNGGYEGKHNRLDVSVVICAYTEDRWDDLSAAIESVREQTSPPLEIIVVADHNPALRDRIRAEMPDVVAIENRYTRGLSGARNSGTVEAKGEVIAFLDDDAVAAPDWLDWLVRGYDDQLVLGVGGVVEPDWLSGRPSWFPEEFDWVVGCAFRGMPERREPVQRIIGANMSIRREVFAAIGGFHSGLGRVGKRPVAGEETEFCIRAIQRWPRRYFLYEPKAKVDHRVPASRGCWEYFRSRCYAEGLSKALVSRLVGTGEGLASERSYAFRTLPRGALKGIGDGLFRRDPVGLARAGAIIAGLAVTTSGYLAGMTAVVPLGRPVAVSAPLPVTEDAR
jgi:glycosyltransferase involved in cell wall biosynthesis